LSASALGRIKLREWGPYSSFGCLIHIQALTPAAPPFRQSVYSRLAGYEDVNDAKRLSQDPTFRLIGSVKI
jgi:hypothetical protein